MKAENNRDGATVARRIGQFAIGTAIGAVIPGLLLQFVWDRGLGWTGGEIIVSILFAVSCGTLCAIWGSDFTDRLLDLISNSTPPI